MSLWKLLTARWGSGAGETDEVRIDAVTNSLQCIAYPHHEIHMGDAFVTSRAVTHGAGASPNILIVTPNTTKWAHFFFQVISDDVVSVTFYEAPDYSGGAALVAYNRNRNSATASGFTLTSDAADDGAGKGTAIWTFSAGANKTVTLADATRLEFILDQNAKYLLEAVGANGDVITFLLDWYEHTDIN